MKKSTTSNERGEEAKQEDLFDVLEGHDNIIGMGVS